MRTSASPGGAPDRLKLVDGSTVGVIGGGPAGSFFCCFLLEMDQRARLALQVDLYEPRDCLRPGPQGYNMCGGLISESLVQNPGNVRDRLAPVRSSAGIDSYVLHMDVASVRIDLPLHEMRIGAIYRGGGPRDAIELRWQSFNQHLLQGAVARGARHVPAQVEEVGWQDGGLGALSRRL